jgi:hypothetical protein
LGFHIHATIWEFKNAFCYYISEICQIHLAKQWHTPEAQFNQQHKSKYSFNKGCSYVLLTADNMGNAYLTSFFVGGAWDHTKLHHSVKAYQNAVSWHFVLFAIVLG